MLHRCHGRRQQHACLQGWCLTMLLCPWGLPPSQVGRERVIKQVCHEQGGGDVRKGQGGTLMKVRRDDVSWSWTRNPETCVARFCWLVCCPAPNICTSTARLQRLQDWQVCTGGVRDSENKKSRMLLCAVSCPIHVACFVRASAACVPNQKGSQHAAAHGKSANKRLGPAKHMNCLRH